MTTTVPFTFAEGAKNEVEVEQSATKRLESLTVVAALSSLLSAIYFLVSYVMS